MNWAYIILLTLVPGVELRGSIPLAAVLGENLEVAAVVVTLVNVLLAPVVLAGLDRVWDLALRVRVVERLLGRQVERVRRKSKPFVEKYGLLGLALFVAVPLPGTGAYTGALAAWLLGIEMKKAAPAIGAGVCIAGALVYLAVKGVLMF